MEKIFSYTSSSFEVGKTVFPYKSERLEAFAYFTSSFLGRDLSHEEILELDQMLEKESLSKEQNENLLYLLNGLNIFCLLIKKICGELDLDKVNDEMLKDFAGVSRECDSLEDYFAVINNTSRVLYYYMYEIGKILKKF